MRELVLFCAGAQTKYQFGSGGLSWMEAHCCEDMRRQVESVCDRHPDPYDCPDALVGYSPRYREYGLLVHDGGASSVGIQFCPWCGTRLPASLRHRWFEELERRGIDPAEGEVPPEFQSSAWWAAPDAEPGAAADRGRMTAL